MFRGMKYIIYSRGYMTNIPVIFANCIGHGDMAQNLNLTRDKISGAGFVMYDEHNGIYVTGRSNDLDMIAKEEDLAFIKKELDGD